MRSSLFDKDKDLITIEQELSLIDDYIEIEKLRFEERLQLETSIDTSLLKFKIPNLSIQLLVENAIKHGIDLKVGGGKILLTICFHFQNNKKPPRSRERLFICFPYGKFGCGGRI